ncbi:MAG TPA: hypothetical protein VF293_04555, partial [Candidatus Limnocylindrales bacterium]
MTETSRAADSKTIAPATSAEAEPAAPMVPNLPTVLDAPEALHYHPNLGLAPADMLAGFPLAAEELRRDQVLIAARALGVAMDWDASISRRYDERARRSLLHDAE